MSCDTFERLKAENASLRDMLKSAVAENTSLLESLRAARALHAEAAGAATGLAADFAAAEQRAEAAEKERDGLRTERTAILHTIRGTVEGYPTGTHNYLQRLRELMAIERERLPWKCSLCGCVGEKTLEAMNDHLLSCAKRPARAAEQRNTELEGALRKLVGEVEHEHCGACDEYFIEQHGHVAEDCGALHYATAQARAALHDEERSAPPLEET